MLRSYCKVLYRNFVRNSSINFVRNSSINCVRNSSINCVCNSINCVRNSSINCTKILTLPLIWNGAGAVLTVQVINKLFHRDRGGISVLIFLLQIHEIMQMFNHVSPSRCHV